MERGPAPLLHIHRETGRIGWAAERAVFIRGDLTRVRDRERLKAVALRHAPLAGAVLCASVFLPSPAENLPSPDMVRMLRFNLEIQLRLAAGLRDALAPGGSMLFFSDTGSVLGWPSYAVYLAAKAGLEAAARSLARTWGPDIIVSCLAPGSAIGGVAPGSDAMTEIIQKRTALGRLAQPGEIARAAVAILDLPASVAQGATFVIDGGRRLFP